MDEQKRKSILIATPEFGGQGTAAYERSLIQTLFYTMSFRPDLSLHWQTLVNESLIPRGRNTLVHMFLKSPHSHLMFIDADMKWEPEDFVKMIDADVDVIAGICPKKEINWQAIKEKVTPEMSMGEMRHIGKSYVCTPLIPGTYGREAIFEVKHIGSAFMLIKREVFEQLQDKVEWYNNDVHDLGGGLQLGERLYEYFSSRVDQEERKLLSEDYFFTKLCRENGISVYAAPWAQIGHWGGFLF